MMHRKQQQQLYHLEKALNFPIKFKIIQQKNSLNQPKFCRVINADRTDIENRKQSIYQKVIAI